MDSEQPGVMSGVWFSCPAGSRPVAAVGAASYLAVHELQVDSFQRDLQQPAFPALHVLDGELPAQFRTWGRAEVSSASSWPSPRVTSELSAYLV